MNRTIISLACGISLFLLIVLSFNYFQNKTSEDIKQIEFGEVLSLVRNKEIREIKFQQSNIELKDSDGNRFSSIAPNEPVREMIFRAVTDYNLVNENAPIKVTEEATSTGWYWILFINTLPFLIGFIFCMVISFYIGTISNRNG